MQAFSQYKHKFSHKKLHNLKQLTIITNSQFITIYSTHTHKNIQPHSHSFTNVTLVYTNHKKMSSFHTR